MVFDVMLTNSDTIADDTDIVRIDGVNVSDLEKLSEIMEKYRVTVAAYVHQ